jgi:SpoVK/Ycf46/Vps4 family AAA+-type ATPase
MEAQLKVVSEFFEKGKSDKPRKITMSDFIEVVKNVKPSISMDSLKKMVEWARKYASTF